MSQPRYHVGKYTSMDVDDNGEPIEGIVWEVYQQYEGPWGTVQVARFKTRKEAREYARRMNDTLRAGE